MLVNGFEIGDLCIIRLYSYLVINTVCNFRNPYEDSSENSQRDPSLLFPSYFLVWSLGCYLFLLEEVIES